MHLESSSEEGHSSDMNPLTFKICLPSFSHHTQAKSGSKARRFLRHRDVGSHWPVREQSAMASSMGQQGAINTCSILSPYRGAMLYCSKMLKAISKFVHCIASNTNPTQSS